MLSYYARKIHRRSLLTVKAISQSLAATRGPRQRARVVLIGGVQRSGTNLLMDILESSLETDVFHETDPRAFRDYEMRPVEDIQRLIAASKARIVVVKTLCELQDMGRLVTVFAPAKALWIVRNYNDMVNSHLRTWSGCPERIERLVADRDSAAWRGRGMSDETHALLSRLFHPGLDDASAVALFWYFRNVLFFEQELDKNDAVTVVSYERLVRSINEEFERIFSFIDAKYHPFTSPHVSKRSVRKNPAPEIEPSIKALCDTLLERFQSLASTR